MNLMLMGLFISLGIGLAARRVGGGQRLAITMIVLVMAGLYQFLGNRFV